MDLNHKLVVAVITRNETKIWATDAQKGEEPNIVNPLPEGHHHVREAQHNGGHDSHTQDKKYYEEISKALTPADEILLIGHGKGKGNAVLQFVQHVERHHHDVAKKIVGSIDENIVAMTDGELLAAARNWFKHHNHGAAGF
jgi:hypothetical protein